MEFIYPLLLFLSTVTLGLILFSIYVHLYAVIYDDDNVILTPGHIGEHLALLTFMGFATLAMMLYVEYNLDGYVIAFISIESLVTSRITLHLNQEIHNEEEYYVQKRKPTKKE